MTTLREIADVVGCSTATVSRALSNDPRISEARRRQIHQEAVRLGYQANQVARSLRRQRSGYVGAIIPNLTNHYYTHCLAHLTDQLATQGLHVVLGCHNFNPAVDASLVQSIVNRKVEGLLHVPCTKEGIEGILSSVDIPVVEIGQRSKSEQVDAVFVDDAKGISELVAYLYKLGHRRITMIAGREELFGVSAQTRGFNSAVKNLDLSKEDCHVIHSPANHQDCTARIESALDDPNIRPTAIVAAHHFAVSAALSVFRSRKIDPPNDISLVGFSNDDWFEVSSPPVTTFEHPFRSMSIIATQLLLARMQPHPDDPSKRETIEFDGRVLERLSSGPPSLPTKLTAM